jgi:hypothetical protein
MSAVSKRGALKQQTSRIRSRRLMSRLIGGLALFAAIFSLVTPALCAPRDCMPPVSSQHSGECQGMPMEKGTGHAATPSPTHCCNAAENPLSATQLPSLLSMDLQVVPIDSLFDVAGASLQEVFVPHVLGNPPPHDLQSLFCILLT